MESHPLSILEHGMISPKEIMTLIPREWQYSEGMFVALYAAYLNGHLIDFLHGGALEIDGRIATTPYQIICMVQNTSAYHELAPIAPASNVVH